MSNEYTEKKVSNHLLITVSRSTCNSLFALSIYRSFSLPCPFAVALYVSRFIFFYRFPFSSSATFSLWTISLPFTLTAFFRLIRLVSFAAFSLIITIYVMIFVNEHTKMPDYYQTIILINLWSEIEFISFATLHSHGLQSWSLLLLLLLFFTASIE